MVGMMRCMLDHPCRPSPSMNRIRSVASLGNLLAHGEGDELPPGCLGTLLSYCVPSVLIPSLIVFSDFIGALASGKLMHCVLRLALAASCNGQISLTAAVVPQSLYVHSISCSSLVPVKGALAVNGS
jgi:hypothetical protein